MNLRVTCSLILLLLCSHWAIAHDDLCQDPNALGSIEFDHDVALLYIEGSFAYVLTVGDSPDEAGLLTLDIHDHGSIVEMDHEMLGAASIWVRKPQVHDGKLYAISTQAVYVFDLLDPSDPVQVGVYENTTITAIESVSFIGDTMYLGSDQNECEIVDISNPSNPVAVDTAVLAYSIIGVIDGIGYTQNGQAVDLSDPHVPVLGGAISGIEDSFRIHRDLDVLYFLGNGQGRVSIADPMNPVLIQETFELLDVEYESFTMRGSMMFVGRPLGGFSASSLLWRDYSHPFDLVSAGEVFLSDEFVLKDSVYHEGLFWVLYSGSLVAYDITLNQVVGTRDTRESTNDVVVFGTHAAVGTEGGSLEIYNISEPRDPVLVSSLSFPDNVRGVDVSGDVLYLAGYRENLNIVDISDPMTPVVIGNIDTGRRATDVEVVGDLLYVVDRFEGLTILDITDPSAPVVLSNLDTPGWAKHVFVDESRQVAFVSHNRFDMQIIDVSDPSAPAVIGSITPTNNLPDGTDTEGFESTLVIGDLLYAAEARDGIQIFDISDLADPVRVNHLPAQADPNIVGVHSTGYTHRMHVDSNRLIVSQGTGGICAYDISDPLNPVQAQWVLSRFNNAVSSVRALAMYQGVVLSTVYEGGLRIYDLSDCVDCVADVNADGSLNFLDVSTFLAAFSAQESGGDFNADGSFNFLDVSTFLAAFAAGCP
jgi:hypothetical protein